MKNRGRLRVTAALFGAIVLGLAGCSSSGGAPEDDGAGEGGGAVADTPAFKVAMITHAPEGDTFFDIIRKGADAAAAKDNIEYTYAADNNAGNQATLVQNAVDQEVDAIAVSMPNADALSGALENARAAGIPVVGFNAGFDDWQELGFIGYFGQNEDIAGNAAGARLAQEGSKKVLCVLQEQGQVQLEARCNGVKNGLAGGAVENIYVTGTDMSSVQSTITAKLQQDPSIDTVLTLGAPFALGVVNSIEEAGSSAKLVTFDTNADLVGAIRDKQVEWAIDQQPYLQGYEAIDALWLYLNNGNTVGGGSATLTGPAFVDSTNIESVYEYAQAGTR
ncbi:substrate-binding domain-containing protein [Kineococcus sp. T13]|uniref:substrate-binding domain-containing protein n=1 Tax=Kineococcus vitellinus TaxID=2696565 RepID=UPI001412C0D9|nr:substrate-binding domain-containing protein [Kineococcus vitellinus]